MRVGARLFSTLLWLSAHFQAVDASSKNEKKNNSQVLAMPEEPKLPVPWQKLAAHMESHAHHKKKAAPKHNHENKSQPVPVHHEAGVHPKKDEAKLESDLDGVVVQPLSKDVAAKVETTLAVATKAGTPAPKEVPQSHTHSKPSDSSIDAMAVLHHQAERKLHKDKKHHETKKVKQNKTISSSNHQVVKQDQPKHTNGLANFEKDMGINSSAANRTTPVKVVTTNKKSHKGKHHKAKKVQSKPSVNLTGDVMSALHHEVATDDTETTVTKPATTTTTTSTTTTTTTTQAPSFSKGLLHLREDMYMGGHPNVPKSHATMPAAASSAKTVHSALTVGKKHHKKKFADFSLPAEIPADPMAAIHKESQDIRKAEQPRPEEKLTAKAAPEPKNVEVSEKHSGGLDRLDQDLGVNKTAVPAEPQKAEDSAPQAKHVPHGAKHHNKIAKSSVTPAKQPAKAADKDPMSSLHEKFHPQDEKPQSAVKLQAKPQVPQAPKETEKPQLSKKPVVHESRRNSLRKLREDIHGSPFAR